MRYSIAEGNTGNIFVLSARTGVLTYVAGPEDFERFVDPLSAFVLTVQATDGSNTVDATVVIAVTDEEDEGNG